MTLGTIVPAAGQTTFFDGTFNSNDWTDVRLGISVNGSTYTAAPDPANGNPLPSRTTTHTYPFGSIFVAHLSQPSVYDPASQGAITAFDYSFDLLHTTPGNVAYSILAFQNGTYYRTNPERLISTGNTWPPSFTGQNVTAADFIKLEGPSSNTQPDFSCKGSRIVFGYVTRNTNSGAGTNSTTSWIDNWSISIKSASCCARIAEVKATCVNGVVTYSFIVTNTSANVIHYLLLSPPPGAPYTISPNVIPLSPPLNPGQSTPVTVTVTNSTPGTPICIDVFLADKDLVACCKVTTCADAPPCDCLKRISQVVECRSGGGYVYTVQLQNLTGTTIQQVFVTATSPTGATVTPQTFAVTIPNNGVATLQIVITGVPPGGQVCLRIVPVGKDDSCCSVEWCFKVPTNEQC